MGSYQSLIRQTAEPVLPEVDSLLGEEVSLFNPDRRSSAVRELTLSSQSKIKICETVKNARAGEAIKSRSNEVRLAQDFFVLKSTDSIAEKAPFRMSKTIEIPTPLRVRCLLASAESGEFLRSMQAAPSCPHRP